MSLIAWLDVVTLLVEVLVRDQFNKHFTIVICGCSQILQLQWMKMWQLLRLNWLKTSSVLAVSYTCKKFC
jgi:hypothetical protein